MPQHVTCETEAPQTEVRDKVLGGACDGHWQASERAFVCALSDITTNSNEIRGMGGMLAVRENYHKAVSRSALPFPNPCPPHAPWKTCPPPCSGFEVEC